MNEEISGVLGYSHYEVISEAGRMTRSFVLVLMSNGLCVQDIIIVPGSEEDLRNTIIGAGNLISWAEEQLSKRQGADAPVAPADK